MFTILILVCSVTIDHAACHRNTAIDVMRGPQVQNEIMCGLFGQTQIAPTALAPKPGLEYLKVECEREAPLR